MAAPVTDLQAELAARLGLKRPALEQSMEVGGDDDAWLSDEQEGGGTTAGQLIVM